MSLALEEDEDRRRYGVLPEPGGLLDQPWEWKARQDCLNLAREWVEAMRNAESNLLSIQSGLEGREDPPPQDTQAFQEAGEHYERVHRLHKERVMDMRKRWAES